MGKKGSWFSAIKKVFTHSSKEKLADGGEKKSSKERKKKGLGKLKHGDGFIPMFREPSSIEKILGEAEREHQIVNHRPATPPERPKPRPPVTPPAPPPPRSASPPKVSASPSTITPLKSVSPPTPPQDTSPPLQRVASAPHVVTSVNITTPFRAPSPRYVQRPRAEPTLREQHISAIKIQAAFRGYVARRSYRALRGLVRLQAVVKGQSVKRQTANALKCMQLLVRVQTQIQSRRVQMLENQALQRQAIYKNDKDLESIYSKWNLSENSEEWDDSTLTKEEIEARMQRKVNAVVKRERAMAYAYSHQQWKSAPKTAQSGIMDIRAGGFPYWWNWLEQKQAPPKTPTNLSQSQALKSFLMTPSRQTSNSPLGLGFENPETSTPRSTKSAIPSRTKLPRTPPGRLQQKLSRGSAANSPFNGGTPFRDDDSLTSCPPFSVPRYMSPTMSAKAKVRDGVPDSPSSINITDDSKRRTSFPLGQEFKKNKGPLFSNKETSSQKMLGKNQSFHSVSNLSVDSTVSMPATVGRKPFNRFV